MSIFENRTFGTIAHHCWNAMKLDADLVAGALNLRRSDGIVVVVERTGTGFLVYLVRRGQKVVPRSTRGHNDNEVVVCVAWLLAANDRMSPALSNEEFSAAVLRANA